MTTDEAIAALGRWASDEDRERALEYVRQLADVCQAGRHVVAMEGYEAGRHVRHAGNVLADEIAALDALDGGGR